MKNKYVTPDYEKASFSCPHCGALTHHFRSELQWTYEAPDKTRSLLSVKNFCVAQCFTCKKYSFWHSKMTDYSMYHEMVYPAGQFEFPEPNADLSDEIKADYLEAGKILRESPRGAAALLRLCVEKLVDSLVPGGGNLNDKIGDLVKNGLDEKIQRALDLTRVIGNEAVHPGLIDIKDDQETTSLLFKTINLIAEKLITLPRQIDNAYENLPPSKLDGIDKRDGK